MTKSELSFQNLSDVVHLLVLLDRKIHMGHSMDLIS